MKISFTSTGRGIHQTVRLTLCGLLAALCAIIAYWYGLATGADAEVAKQILAEGPMCEDDTTSANRLDLKSPTAESPDDILFVGCGGFF